MKTLSIIATFLLTCITGSLYGGVNDQDTVVITLDDDTKIVIYTANKEDLKSIEKYDLNKMIRDLNGKVSRSNSSYVLLEDRNGNSYLKDTTIVYQEGEANADLRLGNMELSYDGDDIRDWDDIEDRWDDDDDFRSYSYIDRDVDRTRNYFNIEIGTNNWLLNGTDFPNETNESFAVRPWGSWYVGLSSINKTWIGGPLFLDWGFNGTFYNWKLEDDAFQVVRGDEQVEFQPVDVGINPIKSKLAATYINFQMVPILDFAKGSRKVRAYEKGGFSFKRSRKTGLRIGAGGYVGYRLGSRSKLVYKEGGDREKDISRGNFYLTNLRYGLRAQLGYKGIDFFANYDLNEVFADGRGPDLNAVSFGIIF